MTSHTIREKEEIMVPLKQALSSSLGKKYLMAISGLALVGFIVTHLLGNLQLYGDGVAFNKYAQGLHDLGPLLWVAEIGLIGVFLLHIAIALGLQGTNRKAAGGSRYAVPQKTKGGPSQMSPLSRNMFITGSVIFIFVVVHVMHMKYGLFSPDAINEQVNGEKFDLYIRVVDAFQNPIWVAFYVGVMLFLGGHLRHGFWSAFQSLGALNHRLEKPAIAAALVVAFIMAAGFLGIPLFIFFTKGA